MSSKEKALVEVPPRLSAGVIENVVIKGDLSRLNDEQRLNYYMTLCHSLNLNHLTKPFEYLQLNGRLVLYATKSCAEQLRARDEISIEDVKTEVSDDFIRVTAKARNAQGRTDVAMAVVSLVGLKGVERANAEMKADTKAKRRVTLSICGLGMLDETEPETIKDARKVTAEEVYNGTAEPEVYVVPFGKYKDFTIEEISTDKGTGIHDEDERPLKSYIKYIREKAESQKKEITGQVADFLDRADSYLESKVLEADFKSAMSRNK